VLDAADESDRAVAVVDLVIGVVQRRLTTASRLRHRLAGRRGHRWRRLLNEVLTDVSTGVRSALERRWLHDVERAHGLPRSTLNRPDRDGDERRYRDAEFLRWGLVVELDGREAHPDAERFRDRRRDNRVTASGRRSLRYGWHEVVQDPCGIAAEVAGVLHSLGWPGEPRPCNPGCPLQPGPR
jgi:Protein of unknown function (DUF559)